MAPTLALTAYTFTAALFMTSREILQDVVDCVLAGQQPLKDRGIEYDIRPADVKTNTVMNKSGRMRRGPAPSFSVTTNKKGHD